MTHTPREHPPRAHIKISTADGMWHLNSISLWPHSEAIEYLPLSEHEQLVEKASEEGWVRGFYAGDDSGDCSIPLGNFIHETDVRAREARARAEALQEAYSELLSFQDREQTRLRGVPSCAHIQGMLEGISMARRFVERCRDQARQHSEGDFKK